MPGTAARFPAEGAVGGPADSSPTLMPSGRAARRSARRPVLARLTLADPAARSASRLRGYPGELLRPRSGPHPAVDRRAGLPGGDQGIAGLAARVPDHVPQPLGVDDELHTRV